MKKLFGMMALILTGTIVQASDAYFDVDASSIVRRKFQAPSTGLVRLKQPMLTASKYGSGGLAQQLSQQIEQLRVIAQRNGGLVTFTVDQTTLDKWALALGGNISSPAQMAPDTRYGVTLPLVSNLARKLGGAFGGSWLERNYGALISKVPDFILSAADEIMDDMAMNLILNFMDPSGNLATDYAQAQLVPLMPW